MLFALYINDMARCSSDIEFILFADDTTLIIHDKTVDKLEDKVNSGLRKLTEWVSANKLTLNVKKTHYMIMTKKNSDITNNIEIKIEQNKLTCLADTKFLGLIIDNRLQWNKHLDYLRVKMSRFIGILRRLTNSLPVKIKKILYFAFVHSTLCYCIEAWGFALKKFINPVFRLQRKAVNYVYGCTIDPSTWLTEVGILPLLDLLKVRVWKLMHSIKIGTSPGRFFRFFDMPYTTHSHNTRQAHTDFNLRTDQMKSFLTEGPKLYNGLPAIVKTSPSLDRFSVACRRFLQAA
jgi:hypothetical protein